jgi:hypothetical protein
MATITTETAATESAPATRRARRSRGSDTATTTGRSHRPQLGGEALLANLTEMVDQLIRENRDLKRALARAEKGQGAGNLGQAARALTGLQRRLNRALESTSTSSRRRAATAPAAAPRTRRKVTDPEVLERRRQALAKARAARAAKRQAAAAAAAG